MTEEHGTRRWYQRGCRCDECRTANAIYSQRHKRDCWEMPTPNHVHGTTVGYQNHGCRCTPCTEANTAAVRTWRAKAKAAQ